MSLLPVSESTLQCNIYPCHICEIYLISVLMGLKPIVGINPKTTESECALCPAHKTSFVLPVVLLEGKGNEQAAGILWSSSLSPHC